MTDLQFLPWEKPPRLCGDSTDKWGWGYHVVPIAAEFRPFAAAFINFESCWTCESESVEVEIGIAPACAVDGTDFLCDRFHTAEEITRLRLSRGREPWRAEIHFDARDVYYGDPTAGDGLWLPWLQFHYFGPFRWKSWPLEELTPRTGRLVETVLPYLCDHALAITAYAWPLRQPYGGS